jgi:tripartite-type tricarboxylate transporter receptor subunit TctC
MRGKYGAIGALMALAVVAFLHPAGAQTFPSRPVKIVVPILAGGGMDISARFVAQKMSETLGQQVVVENRPGAGTVVGSEYVARSAPDGYTLLFGGFSNIAVNVTLYSNLPYDPVRDLVPVAMLVEYPFVLVVDPSLPARNVRELIALAKAQPGKLNYGSGGNGAGQHLAAEMFRLMADIDLIHVPYRGTAPVYMDMAAKQIQMMLDNISAAMPQIESGRVRALAVTGAARSPIFPDLPTIKEDGLPDYELSSWFGLFAPIATPPDIVARLNTEAMKAVRSPDIRERFLTQGGTLMDMTQPQATAFIKAEIGKWGQVVRASGARPE